MGQGSKNRRYEEPVRPLYLQVSDLLADRIAEGTLKPDLADLSEIALSLELGVSTETVRKALEDLKSRRAV